MTSEIITLPDGTQGAILRSMDYGDAVIILLLAALLFLRVYELWRQHEHHHEEHRHQHQHEYYPDRDI
jgi:ABC-type nickel/cobalt efflux system permease component RcnA